MNVVLRASMLVMVSALAVVWAACGGDSDDEAAPTKAGGTAGTAVATTAAKPTSSPGTPAVAAEKYGDFTTQEQSSINNLCVWAATAAAGDLTAEEPFVGLVDARGFAAVLRAGQLGKTFEQHGEALGEVANSEDPAELKAVGTDISAACEDIGWTAP